MDAEAYVMPSYVKLLVVDASRSIAFYEALGFERIRSDSVFTHLRWARYADLFLVTSSAARAVETRRGFGVLLCYQAGDAGVDGIAARARAAGAAIEGPADTPWHTREVVVVDPDGFRLTFVEPAGGRTM